MARKRNKKMTPEEIEEAKKRLEKWTIGTKLVEINGELVECRICKTGPEF